MVSDESGEVESLRQEVRTWLIKNLPEKWGTPEYKPPERLSRDAHELGKSFTRRLYDAGYTGFGYPKEYGGIERPSSEITIIREELARCGTPPGPLSLGLLMVVDTLLAWGQEWQKERFIPKILSGDESWCVGFSEPNAGSDMSNIQTMAVRQGDDWVVNGQKCWTSMWEFADWSLLITKTDVNAPRHRNLTYFIFDTNTPGFSRYSLRQMSGESEFGEMLHENWMIKRQLTTKITNAKINKIYEKGIRAGAIGGKILGAGGGGFMLFFVKPEKQSLVKRALKDYLYVPFRFDNLGSQVVYYMGEHGY